MVGWHPLSNHYLHGRLLVTRNPKCHLCTQVELPDLSGCVLLLSCLGQGIAVATASMWWGPVGHFCVWIAGQVSVNLLVSHGGWNSTPRLCWMDVFYVFYLWPWKVVARLTGDGLCSHHGVIAVGNKLLLADCQPLSCPPGPEEAQETKCHDQDVAEPRTASNSGCETMHGTRAGKATGQELRQLHSPTTSVQRGGHLGWLVTFCSPTGSGQSAPHHSTMVGSRMMLAAPPGAGHGWDCSKAGEAIRFWEWQREWLSTEKSYPSSTAGLSRCICNIISLKGSAYKTQNSFSCNIHTQKGKKCPAFFDREGGKTL